MGPWEVGGCIMLALMVIGNAISFFENPKKRNERIYEQTAKDTSFNRIVRKK